MMQRAFISFFTDNEKNKNRRLAYIVCATLLTTTASIICGHFGLFQSFNYLRAFLYLGVHTACIIGAMVFFKLRPGSKHIKTIFLMLIQSEVCYLATTRGMYLFISYLFVPCLSLLYYDKLFTRLVTSLCYVAMLAILLYRLLFIETAQAFNMSTWLLTYGLGLSIEYLLCMFVLMSVSNTAERTIYQQYRARIEAEDARMEAEDVRMEAEEAKREADKARIRAEEALIGAEETRLEAEEARKRAELARQKEQKAREEAQEKAFRVLMMQQQMLNGFANLVESKDLTTGEHIKRTTAYVLLLCRSLKQLGFYNEQLNDREIEYIINAAPLHDLGKIQIPDAILSKPGRLTDEEFAVIKQHPIIGERLIRENMQFFEDEHYITTARHMALYHHERWDGKGYPNGIKGEEIPLCARIMAVADVLDALLHKRSYKEAMPFDQVISIMQEGAGTQFDPAIVQALMSCLEQVKKIGS